MLNLLNRPALLLAVWLGVGGIPATSALPTASNLSLVGSQFAPVDIALGIAEGPVVRPISGSYQAGFAVPCQQQCAHLELGPPFLGAKWISGDVQDVPGGSGVLGQAFGGREPTGRHPFGAGVKVVITGIDEATGTAQLVLYFRKCKIYVGCTPYIFGPFPFMTVSEGQWIAL